MNLKQLNRQQKILLIFGLPTFLLIIIFISHQLFTSTEPEVKNKGELNTILPTSRNNIESEKISAYNKEQQYIDTPSKNNDFIIANYAILNDTEKRRDSIEMDRTQVPTKSNNTRGIHKLETRRKELITQQEPLKAPDKGEISGDGSKITFNSIVINEKDVPSNENSGSIAFIHGDQTVHHGSIVKIRTGEEMVLQGSQKIKQHSFMYGHCSLVGERINIKIMRVQDGSNIINCNLSCYGTDGNIGIYIPSSIKQKEGKKSSSKTMKNIGSVLGSGVSIASGGLLGDITETIAEGTINAIADGSAKSMQQIKIFLPNNEKIYIK